MKQYFLRMAGSALLLSLFATCAMAQEDSKDKDKSKLGKNDMLIIKSKEEKDAKVVIEIKGGEVTVNGKPLDEYKDDNVTIRRSKEFGGVAIASGSRFRASGATNWNADNNMNMELSRLDMFNDNKAFLGVTTDKADDGAKISSVSEKSAAEKAGLKKGDVITKINDIKVENQQGLTEAIGKFKPEDKVTVTIKRDGKEQKIAATLGKRAGGYAVNMAPYNAFNYSYSINGHGRLGLKAQETEDGKGLKVLDVDDESNAAEAGIKEGDIITEFDGTAVNDIDKLRELSKTAMSKPSFKVKVNRNGKTEDITVKIPKNLKTTNL
jgi:serine protease Do